MAKPSWNSLSRLHPSKHLSFSNLPPPPPPSLPHPQPCCSFPKMVHSLPARVGLLDDPQQKSGSSNSSKDSLEWFKSGPIGCGPGLHDARISGFSYRRYFSGFGDLFFLNRPSTGDARWITTDTSSNDTQLGQDRDGIGDEKMHLASVNDGLTDGGKKEKNTESSRSPVHAICLILKKHGWGPGTVKELAPFFGNVTSDAALNVLKKQTDGEVTLRFFEWAADQEGFQHSEWAFDKVICRLCTDKKFATALAAIERYGCWTNHNLSVLLHRLAKEQLLDEMADTIARMKQSMAIPCIELYTFVVGVFIVQGRFQEAQTMQQQMLQDGVSPDAPFYKTVILTHCKRGNMDVAFNFYKEMRSKGFLPDFKIYDTIVSCLYTSGKLEEGHNLFEEMIGRDFRFDDFSAEVLACALHGNHSTEQAEKVLNLTNRNPHTFNKLLQILFEAGKVDETVEFFERMSVRVEETVDFSPKQKRKGCIPDFRSYAILLSGLCNAGRVVDALRFYRKMLQEGVQTMRDAYNHLLLALSTAGMLDEAFELSSHAKRKRLRINVDVQKVLFLAIRDSGQFAKGHKVFLDLKRKGLIHRDVQYFSLVGLAGQ